MIPESFIQDLLARVDIVDVVGQRVKLKKSGVNFSGLCPFHAEKSPSFMVHPVRQFYHCFGCGKGGSAISFLMDFAGLGFVEAVEELARDAGMTVPNDGPAVSPETVERRKKEKLALNEVMDSAGRFYKKSLKHSPRAVSYLKNRGLTGEVAARFGLGYSPDARDGLKGAFENYAAGELTMCGLVIEKDDGPSKLRYDRFRDRIMFPIRNVRGEIIGFGARVIDKGEPKYLNSPETVLFKKGEELYGLYEARTAIRQTDRVIVVEGYMDVVALAQSGVENAVATLGTACTPMQVQKLFRQCDRIVFSFDGDNAGRQAARRALEAALPYVNESKSVSFLFLPQEHDPDSYVREFGKDAFDSMVDKAMPLSEFLVSTVTGDNNLSTMEGRAKLWSAAKPLCRLMKPSALRSQILKKISFLAQVSEEETVAEFKGEYAREPAAKKPRARREPVTGLEEHVMRLMIAYPLLATLLTEDDCTVLRERFPDGGYLFDELIDICRNAGAELSVAAMTESIRERGLTGMLEKTISEALTLPFDEEQAYTQFEGALRQTHLKRLSEEKEKLLASSLPTEEKLERYAKLSEREKELRQTQGE